MTHYICTGTCGGVADKLGVCQAVTCPMHDKSLVACDCIDGKHNGHALHEVKEKEEKNPAKESPRQESRKV